MQGLGERIGKDVTDMFGKESVWKVGGMYELNPDPKGLGIFLGF